MELRVFVATLLRRWYLVVVVLVCAVAATFVAVNSVGPTYRAQGAVLLFPPVTTVQQGQRSETVGNPYLMLGGLSQVRDIVIRSMTGQTSHAELCRERDDPGYESMRRSLCGAKPTVSYEAVPDFTNSAPIILITVEADSKAHAITAVGALMDRVPVVLGELQSGLRLEKSAEITSSALIADTEPEAVRKSQIRGAIVGGAGTLGLGLLMIALLDGILLTKRVRRPKPVEAASPGWWDVAPEPVAHTVAKPSPRVDWDTATPARG